MKQKLRSVKVDEAVNKAIKTKPPPPPTKPKHHNPYKGMKV